MILPVQQRPQARQAKEKALSRQRRNLKGTVSDLALDRSQALQQLAGPEELDLDGRVHVRLEELQNPSRHRRGVQDFAACVKLDLSLLPSGLEVFVLDNPAGLAGMEKAEAGAEGRGRPGEHKNVAPGDAISFILFSHAAILSPARGIVKAG